MLESNEIASKRSEIDSNTTKTMSLFVCSSNIVKMYICPMIMDNESVSKSGR